MKYLLFELIIIIVILLIKITSLILDIHEKRKLKQGRVIENVNFVSGR